MHALLCYVFSKATLVLPAYTMYDFHDSTDIFVNPSFLPFCTQNEPWICFKSADSWNPPATGILVPKVVYDAFLNSKLVPQKLYTPEAYVCITRLAQKCQ